MVVCGWDGNARDCKSLRTQFDSGTHLQIIGLLAQLDRASDYESEGRAFDSLRDCHYTAVGVEGKHKSTRPGLPFESEQQCLICGVRIVIIPQPSKLMRGV